LENATIPATCRNIAALNDGMSRVQTSIRPALPLTTIALALALALPAAAGPYILVDADSGRVIVQHEAGRQWYPASVTKLMTVYLAFRAIRAGKVTPDTLLTVSEKAAAEPPSKMGFRPGTQMTVDNALKMLMVKSANDIAVVLAEGVGGSVPDFVAEMNKVAVEIGMYGTQFRNPNGLPDDEQVTTARDMALLARQLLREFPERDELFRIPAIRFGKRVMRNHNKLIDRYPGTDGMKTGFICASGFNVVATATRGNKRLIAVVFGSRSSHQRALETARLLERGFAGTLSLATLFPSNRPKLELIENVAVGPVDMRDDMCGPKRKRRAAETEEEEEVEATDPDPNEALRFNGDQVKKVNLLVDLPPSMPPVRVFVGAQPSAEADERASVTKKKPRRSKATRKKPARSPKAAAQKKPAADKKSAKQNPAPRTAEAPRARAQRKE
jgi:D-alanyl-D-alanine carboxypeptidase